MESSVEKPDSDTANSAGFSFAFAQDGGDEPGAGGPSSKSGVLDTVLEVWVFSRGFLFLEVVLRLGVLDV